MKQSDPLNLVQAGTLSRPGPIGRFVRFALGIFCLYALWEIFLYLDTTSTLPVSTFGNRILVFVAPIWLINYVVNIGFSMSWGRRPLFVSLTILTTSMVAAYLITGSFDNPIFGIPLNLWLIYFYSHLGVAFILAAFLATPGCEMRSIPELIGRLRGISSEEHHCPASFLNNLDAWEYKSRQLNDH